MTKYVAIKPDANGHIAFTNQDHATWQFLFNRQLPILKHRACPEFLAGLKILNLSADKIPQPQAVTAILKPLTNWEVVPVEALISHELFFEMIADRRFPCAMFVRSQEDIDYIEEPDIFHEYFGHCPLLTNQVYADFMAWYGQLALKTDLNTREYLARLFWYTIEFGLIKTDQGMRIYGGGILSSKGESVYALENQSVTRELLTIDSAMARPFDIDVMQPHYYYIEKFSDLYDLMQKDLLAMASQFSDNAGHEQ